MRRTVALDRFACACLTALAASCASSVPSLSSALGSQITPETPAAPPREPDPDSATSLFVVAGPGLNPAFEGADTYQPIPFTVLRFGRPSYAIETEGLDGRVDVVPRDWNTGWGFGPSFAFRLAREDTDDAALDQLETIDTAVEVGGFVRYVAKPGWLAQDSLETRLTVNADVTGTHDGVVAQLESDYAWFPKQNIRYSVGLRASSASGAFMDTYFGVTPEGSAASGLDAFDPSGGIRSVGAQASALFLFSENHGIFGLLRYDRLIGDAADSPIVQDVGSEDQILVGVGYTYRF
ncbi:MAG: MipA/OmpV family protein [Planctomycetota bacterium]